MPKHKYSDRLNLLPPYLFDEIDKLKAEALAKGEDLVDLGVGDPVEPTFPPIISKLQKACEDKKTHRYPSYRGERSFCEAVASFYKRRFGLELNPDKEVLALIGAKEGIAHLPLAFINAGDSVLIPDPGYPVYHSGTLFAGGEPVWMPLLAENGFLPDLDDIEKKLPKRCKMMWLSYPNNPTTGTATLEFFQNAVDFALKHDIIICHDAAYTEITFDGYTAPSILQLPEARECAIEFQSMSKTFNMTGWRVGYAVGNEELITGLAKVKVNLDSGVFTAIQHAGIEALKSCNSFIKKQNQIYKKRRDILVKALNSAGFIFNIPKATIYIWAQVPEGYDSKSFTKYLLKEKKIVVSPGNGFGRHGEGYFRISLTCPDADIEKAAERFSRLKF